MGKRYISVYDLGGILPGYDNHGYVYETWREQLVADNLPTKPTPVNTPSGVGDLDLVGGFTDPVKRCAFDGPANDAITDLHDAFLALWNVLKSFETPEDEAAYILNQVSVGFEGYFADVFTRNKSICQFDGQFLSDRALALVSHAFAMSSFAEREQQNRVNAKEVYKDHYKWWVAHKDWEVKYDRYKEYRDKKRDQGDYHVDINPTPSVPDPGDEPRPTREMQVSVREVSFPELMKGLGEPSGGREDLSGVGSSGTTTSGVPENLRVWGLWWRARRDSVRNAVTSVADAYIKGRFNEAAIQAAAFEDEGGAAAVGKQKGTPGWKWGQIVGLCDENGEGGFLGTVRQFCDANDRDAYMLDVIADCFEWADSVGIKELEYTDIQNALDKAGVGDYTRSHVTIGDLGFAGVQPSSGYAYDPVNVATGSLTEVEVDVQFAGAAASFGLTRTYNAGDKTGGVFGQGWFSVLDGRLDVSPSEVSWRRSDGALVSFDTNPAVAVNTSVVEASSQPYWLTYGDVSPVFEELASIHGQLFTVSDNTGGMRVFDREGVLVGFTGGGPGGGVACERDGQGRLTRLLHASGKYVECEYADSGVVSRVTSSDGREVVYSYVDNHLVSVASSRGVRQYEWDEEAGVLARTTDESGVVLMDNTFDQYGRVVTQKTPAGRTAEFIYLPSGVSVVRDADTKDDECADRWVSDKDARLVGMIDSHGAKMSIARDRFGNPVSVVDREGRETLRVFDSRSRLTLQVTPEGVRTSMEWDEWDRPVKITREIPALAPSLQGEISSLSPSSRGASQQGAECLKACFQDRSDAVAVSERSERTATEAISSRDASCVVDETVLVYSDPDQTGGVVVRTPVSVTDSEGVTYILEHDEHGRVSALCGAEGYRLAFDYDEVTGELKSITNALDQTVSFTYDATGNITSSTSPSGALTQFEWDSAGHMVKRIDPHGAVYGFVYENDRLVSQVAPDGGVTTYVYGENGKATSVTDPLGRTTEFTHDSQGNTTTTTKPSGDTWTTVHDSMSRLTKVLSPVGDEWTYDYSANGEIESVTNPMGLITSLTKTFFDGGSQLETTTSVPESEPVVSLLQEAGEAFNQATSRLTPVVASLPNPHPVINGEATRQSLSSSSLRGMSATKQSYGSTAILDALGRPVRVCSPDGVVLETRVYDKVGRVSEVLDGEAGLTRYEYNSLGFVSKIIAPDESVTEYIYDAAARLVKKSDSSGSWEEYEYDADGRVTRIVNQDGEEQLFTYDVCGRLLSSIVIARECDSATEAISTVSYSYDVCGRVVSVTDSVHGTRSFVYDLAGQVVSVTDANGNSTVYAYTAGGLVESVTSPDGGVTLFEYDCYGNMTKKTDPLGRVETRIYDPTGNLTGLTRADNTGLSYNYNVAGRLLGIENHKGETLAVYDYDTTARTVTITDSLANTEHKLVFDCLGRLISKTTGDTTLVYTYNKVGRRESMTITRGGQTSTTVSYTYTPTGELEEVAHSTFGVLDPLSRGSEAGVAISSSPVIASEAKQSRIERDQQGRISRIVTSDSDVSYEYDTAGQLTSLTDNATGETTAYAYDVCGRLMAITGSEGETRFAYNTAGELTSRALPDGTVVTYAYDECGRRMRETRDGSIAKSFEWDNLGYLARVTSPSSRGEGETFDEAICLTHDVFGNLASLTDGEETTRFLWDTNTNAPTLLQAGNQDVFTALGHTAYGTLEENTGWVSHGWRDVRPTNPVSPWGLPAVIASLPTASEAISSSYSAMRGVEIAASQSATAPRNDGMMLPWGVLLGGSVSVFGLELMGARVYDPFTHGFLSTDPLPPVPGMPYAGNPYEYAGNNPLALFDPLGLRALTDEEYQAMAESYNLMIYVANNEYSVVEGFFVGLWDGLVGDVSLVAGVIGCVIPDSWWRPYWLNGPEDDLKAGVSALWNDPFGTLEAAIDSFTSSISTGEGRAELLGGTIGGIGGIGLAAKGLRGLSKIAKGGKHNRVHDGDGDGIGGGRAGESDTQQKPEVEQPPERDRDYDSDGDGDGHGGGEGPELLSKEEALKKATRKADDNLDDVLKIDGARLTSGGRFGVKDKGAQVWKSKDPDKTAEEVFEKLTKGGVECEPRSPVGYGGKAKVMSDGRLIIYRPDSSSKCPAIDIQKSPDSSSRIAEQRIHFKPLDDK